MNYDQPSIELISQYFGELPLVKMSLMCYN